MKPIAQGIWTVLLALSCLLGAPAGAADSAVGIVLDVQGGGELLDRGQASRLQLLSYLRPGTQLRLDSGAHASVSHYRARLIYQLSGPLLAVIDDNALRVLQGAAPVSKSLAEKVVQAALSPGTGPAAFKMRVLGQELKLLGPRQGSAVLATRPTFRWEAGEPASYQLLLERADGQPVLQVRTDNPSWQPDAAQALSPGQSYRWTVRYQSAVDGEQLSASAQFSVLSEAERASITAMRPGADAGIDELVLYATVLQNRQLWEEARLVWGEIAARRPDLSQAGSLAR